MSIRLLRTLVAVADTKTFSAAAEIVNVTHAAVSQQMRALEAEYGVALFDRRGRTPVMTPVGLQVVAKARKVIAEYDDIVPSVLEDGGMTGIINLGVMRTTLTGLIPPTIASLQAEYPDLGWHIHTGLTQDLLLDIERGTLDAAIVSKPHLLPMDVVFHQIAREPMHLIAACQEPLDDPMVLLRDRPFIRFDRRAVVGAMIDTWILSRQIQVRQTMELDSPEAIASMVHANLGVSIVPELAVKPRASEPVKYLDLGPDAPVRVLGLVYKKQNHKQAAFEQLFNAMSRVVEDAAR